MQGLSVTAIVNHLPKRLEACVRSESGHWEVVLPELAQQKWVPPSVALTEVMVMVGCGGTGLFHRSDSCMLFALE